MRTQLGYGSSIAVIMFIMRFYGQWGTDWALILAFVTLTLIPTLVFYLFAERHIVTGLTAGAVKG